ncbi:conserved hypothetical protein [Altererythrobacter sp. B11]|uniref:helix-turn-helix domain-containing protein n=1 Tax=Altererythrobacter sp. B11 TaxID=2060312 RepID=UPI000DC73249|nr:DUF4019 domain-containing protein [Altererythrobacter sp. B11]BBC71224.1 conserved hypothetical protein [Altererythrobacter sp. B11]
MAQHCGSLTEKEKETLRLILQGHDAKSMAVALDLSVHTINERLRGARRKLGVTSSKEAARLLREREAQTPQFSGPKPLGEAGSHGDERHNTAWKGRIPRPLMIGVLLAMSIMIAAALASLTQPAAPAGGPQTASTAATSAESDVTRAARDWLALVDAEEWQASWAATGAAFRELNSAETWARVSKDARPPLGAVLSRQMLSQESVPAPPMGYEMVKFTTRFANRPDATETLSLVKEGDAWKVVGYWIS